MNPGGMPCRGGEERDVWPLFASDAADGWETPESRLFCANACWFAAATALREGLMLLVNAPRSLRGAAWPTSWAPGELVLVRCRTSASGGEKGPFLP